MLTDSSALWRTVDSERRRQRMSASYTAAASKPENAKGLKAQPDIDGFLVGGASLDPVRVASIVNA